MLLLAGGYREGPITNAVFGNRTSILVGEASYSIYLLQVFTLVGCNIVMRNMHFRGSAAVLEALAALIMVGTGVLCFLYVEEPIRQAILRRFSSRGVRQPAPHLPAVPAPDTQISATIS
jgi:peptidoglycan/LPS O-acetylase OafA/YrhL